MDTTTTPESAEVCGQFANSADNPRTEITSMRYDQERETLIVEGVAIKAVPLDKITMQILPVSGYTEQPTPDHGEPWQVISPTRTVRDRHDKIVSSDEAHSRMLQCVNACAGMADPAAEIQAKRSLLEQAEAMIGAYKGERDELRRDIAALLNALPNGAHDVTEGVGTIKAMRDALNLASIALCMSDDEVDPPDTNCSCHINPPCNDCVDHSQARETKEFIKSALAKLKPFTTPA